MKLSDLFGYGQTQPVATAASPSSRAVCPVKTLENMRQFGGGDTLALVSDLYLSTLITGA